MNTKTPPLPIIDNELDLLAALVPLDDQEIIELGCGSARLVRELLQRHPGSRAVGLEVDARQHAKNLAAPQERLDFVAGVAQAIPSPDASVDLALMLKSLHHVPLDAMAAALAEVARVLRPGGHLYVSEPVYAGAMNEVMRLFNDEGVVREAAQRALDGALQAAASPWRQVAERRFDNRMDFRDFDDFELRMMRPTYADHCLDEAKIARVRAAFEPHQTATGVHFVRPNHVRLLQRR